MRKFKLDIDELVVESFEPSKEAAKRGTVLGHATHVEECGPTLAQTCDAAACGGGSGWITCYNYATCDGPYDTCNVNDTCFSMDGDYTCYDTCRHPCRP
jgi:hypothetical protein